MDKRTFLIVISPNKWWREEELPFTEESISRCLQGYDCSVECEGKTFNVHKIEEVKAE